MIFAADIMSLQRSQTEVLVELFSKSSWCPEATPWSLVATSEKLELDLFNSYRQGAFAGEFFNPNIGVKKRGFDKRKLP